MSGYLNLPVTTVRDGQTYAVQKNGQQVTYPYSLGTVDWDLWLEAENASRYPVSSTGGTTSIDGNRALVLDGTNYLTVPDDKGDFDFASTFTIEGYVYLTDSLVYVAGGNANSSQSGVTFPSYIFEATTTTLRFGMASSFGVWPIAVYPSYTFNLNEWYHVAVSRDADDNIRMFANGVLIATSSYTGTITNGLSVLGIGGITNDRLETDEGKLSRVHISTTCRYTSDFTPPVRTADIVVDEYTVLALDFAGAEGWKDSSPSQHFISVNGDVQLDGNGALVLDGVGDYLSSAYTGDRNLGSDNFTWEAWVKPTSITTGSQGIVNLNISSTAVTWLSLKNGVDQGLRFVSYTGSFSTVVEVLQGDQTGWVAGDWHHVAVTRDGSTFTIWLNGVEVGTATSSATLDNANSLTIGALQYGATTEDFFDGEISQVRLSNGIARYTTTFTPPVRTDEIVIDTNVTLALNFDGPAGQTQQRIIDLAKPSYAINLVDSFDEPNIYDKIWDDVDSEFSINNERLRGTISSGFTSAFCYCNNVDHSGDFTIEVDWFVIALNNNSRSNRLRIYIGGSPYEIYRAQDPGGQKIVSNSSSVIDSATSGSFKIERVGNTLTYFYDVGAGYVAHGTSTVSGDLTEIRLGMNHETSPSDVPVTGDFDNFTTTDANGDPIQIETDLNSTVPILPDASGNENDASQSTVASQPKFNPFNNSMIFDGSNDMLQTATNVLPIGAKTIFMVFKISGDQYGNILSENNAAGANNGTEIFYHQTTDDLRIGSSDGSPPGRFDLSSANVNDGNYHILTHVWDGTTNANTAKAYTDGVLSSVATSTSTESVGGTTPLSIGQNSSGSNPLDGEIQSILVYAGVLNDKEFRRVTQYLKAKYGVA